MLFLIEKLQPIISDLNLFKLQQKQYYIAVLVCLNCLPRKRKTVSYLVFTNICIAYNYKSNKIIKNILWKLYKKIYGKIVNYYHGGVYKKCKIY